jgi:tetratricopeptide (TPR) repeat protein
VVPVFIRISVLVLCSFVVWRTAHLATADFLAHDGNAADFDRAVRMEPGDESLLAGRAIYLTEQGVFSPDIDKTLRQAVSLNPLDANAWMTLGLRAEKRGDGDEAERDLVQAAATDHTFKPAWTLANYYFRVNQTGKFREAVSRCLSLIEPKDLQPVSFDPTPIFDLCWRQEDRSKRILDLVPRRKETLIPYLKYLYRTNRTDAALEAWLEVLRVAGRADAADADELIRFDEHLITVKRMPEAIAVWNELEARGIAPAFGRGFAWRIQHPAGVFATETSRDLRFEFTGAEPEDCELLWRYVPVAGDATWRLKWTADTSRLDSASGLWFEKGEESCPLTAGSCEFKAGGARLSLKYTRASGTTRIKGTLVLASVRP